MSSMIILGASIPGLTGSTGIIHTAMTIMLGAMGVFSLLRGSMLAKQAYENAQAAIETAAQALVQNWVAIAIAGLLPSRSSPRSRSLAGSGST